MATETQNAVAPIFMGEFCHSIDGKNRITIPSAWRFGEEEQIFLIPSNSGNCLKAMPRAEVDRVRKSAGELTGPERAAFFRHFGSQGRQCTLDKSGRLSLPEEFCKRLKLSGEVTLSGALDTFEIWNTNEWEAARPKNEAVADSVMLRFGV